MKIKSVKLVNVCQHEDREFVFQDGITGIVGPNGSGKSNLMIAIQFAITGDWVSIGTRDRRVRWTPEGEEPTEAYVELKFEHNGEEGRIKRSLIGSDPISEMVFKGKQIKGITKINNAMEEIIGCSSQFINSFIFIKQGEIDRLVNATPANFSKSFQMLFNLEAYEQMHSVIKKEFNETNSNIVYVDTKPSQDRYDENERKIENIAKIIEDFNKKMEEFSSPSYEEKKKRISQYEYMSKNYQSKVDQKSKIEKSMKEDADNVASLNSNIASLSLKIAETEDAAKKYDAEIKLLENQMSLYEKYSNVKGRLTHYEQEIQSYEEKIRSLQEPVNEKIPKDAKEKIQNKKETLNNMASEIKSLKHIHQSFKEGDRCPTCGTSMVVSADYKEEKDFTLLVQETEQKIEILTRDYDALNINIKKMEQAYESFVLLVNEYNNKKMSYETTIQNLHKEKDKCLKEIESVGEHEAPPKERYKELSDLIRKNESNKSSISSSLFSDQSKLSEINGRLRNSPVVLKEIEEFINLFNSLSLSYSDDSAYVKKYEEISVELFRNKEINKVLMSSRDTYGAELKAMQEKVDKYNKDKKYLSLLEGLAALFDRENMPSILSQTYFEIIENGWNEVLGEIGVPFFMRIDENNNVNVIHKNGTCYLQELSGGEKCCAGISLYLTIHKYFSKLAGFMFMDEPTYGSDAPRITYIADFVRRVGEYCKNTDGTQIFISTHCDRLLPSFTNIVYV